VLVGKILKKNRWFMEQERRFELYANGDLKYYKGTEHKGTMVLTKRSKALKTGRTNFEVVLPDVGKCYKLLQIDQKVAPPKGDGYSCQIDDWVDAINFVVSIQSI